MGNHAWASQAMGCVAPRAKFLCSINIRWITNMLRSMQWEYKQFNADHSWLDGKHIWGMCFLSQGLSGPNTKCNKSSVFLCHQTGMIIMRSLRQKYEQCDAAHSWLILVGLETMFRKQASQAKGLSGTKTKVRKLRVPIT